MKGLILCAIVLAMLGVGLHKQIRYSSALESKVQLMQESLGVLEEKNRTLNAALVSRETELKKVREESNALRRQVAELAERDQQVEDWGHERLPDSLLELLVCVPKGDCVPAAGGKN